MIWGPIGLHFFYVVLVAYVHSNNLRILKLEWRRTTSSKHICKFPITIQLHFVLLCAVGEHRKKGKLGFPVNFRQEMKYSLRVDELLGRDLYSLNKVILS